LNPVRITKLFGSRSVFHFPQSFMGMGKYFPQRKMQGKNFLLSLFKKPFI